MEGRHTLGALSRSPAFAALFTARGVSLLGDGVGSLALVVHVQRTEGTGTALGLLLLVASLPSLLSPLTGTVADRMDRRSVLVAAELAQGLALAVVVVSLPPLPLLLLILLVKSTVTAIADPAGRSAIPALVPDEDLPAANALIGGLRQAGEVLGPLLGGVVVAAFGVRAGVAVDALTFLVSVPLLARLPSLRAEAAPGGEKSTTVAGDAWEGLSYTLRHPVARALTAGFFLIGLTSADDLALPFLARTLEAGERGIGALYAAVGAGLIVGFLLVARARRLPMTRGLILGGAVAAIGDGLTGVAPAITAAVAFQTIRGVGLAFYDTNLQTMVQRTVPGALMGRVFANLYGAVNLAACLGLLAGGPLLDATSARVVLVAVGVVGLTGVASTAVLLRAGSVVERLDAAPPER